MKKITSLMVMLVLCCAGAFAQATEFTDKLIRIGEVQEKMVPGTWYFLHCPRNVNQNATAFGMPGDGIQSAGGLVHDMGLGSHVKLTTTSVIEDLNVEDGVSANNHMDKFVRFVAVEGKEGAYRIEFGTGNFMAAAPGSGTVTKYNVANAGEYNFYLVTIGGAPNTAGRFAWNKYNMLDRVDNNGAGGTVVFWSNGETTAEGEKWATADEIKGNKIWQIYDVYVVGDITDEMLYATALDELAAAYNELDGQKTFFTSLENGENVGNSYGNYRPEDVAEFLALWNALVEKMTDLDKTGDPTKHWTTADEIYATMEEIEAAYEKMTSNRVPLAVAGIAPGYYTINSMLNWYETKQEAVYYTQEECDLINEQEGRTEAQGNLLTTDSIKSQNNVQVDAPIKSLYAKTDNGSQLLAWGTQEAKNLFLWKLETVEGRPTEYRLINMYKEQTFNSIPTSANIQLTTDDTVTVIFDYMGEKVAPVIKDSVTAYAIRLPKNKEGEAHYVHCGGHGGGANKSGNTVGWSAKNDDGDIPASQWYITPVDDATAEAWMTSDEVKLRNMIEKADSILGTVPAQLKIAKDIVVTIHENDSVITNYTQITANSTTLDARENITIEDTYKYLLDGNPATFWHSAWEGGVVGKHVHYLQITANEALEGSYSVKLSRRSGASNDHPTKLAVRGYNENNSELTFDEGDDLGVLSFPFNGAGKVEVANEIFEGKGHTIFRFYWEESAPAANQRGYFHLGDFNIFKATESTYYPKTQYQVRSAEATRLEAAIAAWKTDDYTVDSLDLYTEEEFNNVYNELVAAAEAWAAVYVDPAALREAIKDAPDLKLFTTEEAIGTNPGQWAAGAETPAGAIADAKTYDESGAYTPEQSKEYIKGIADATEKTFDSANKVKTGVWYRFKFPALETYEKFSDWDLAGADTTYNSTIEDITQPSLFGKVIAPGKGVTDYVYYDKTDSEGQEVTDSVGVHYVAAVEFTYSGENLYVHEYDSESGEQVYPEGDDLFRFIEATDTSYMIQHKNSGLFLKGGLTGSAGATLSPIPTYFQTKAVGAGTNIISATNIFGEKPTTHVNLHIQRDGNRVVSWQTSSVGSNSALLIEEVEAVTEEPATNFNLKLWPGRVYAYTYPVDITLPEVIENEEPIAAAYGVELTMGEDTTIILKSIKAQTISAGTPFIMIASTTGDYISYNKKFEEVSTEVAQEYGKYTWVEKQIANERMQDEYAIAEFEHGMEADTVLVDCGDLVGTFRDVTINAGKSIVPSENGFAHTTINTTTYAYGAYIKCDFDPTSADMAGTIKIKIEGSIDTGINEVLSNVAKNGNIYTVDGKLVGKGNINAINRMPAGVYIINGTKVVKN